MQTAAVLLVFVHAFVEKDFPFAKGRVFKVYVSFEKVFPRKTGRKFLSFIFILPFTFISI